MRGKKLLRKFKNQHIMIFTQHKLLVAIYMNALLLLIFYTTPSSASRHFILSLPPKFYFTVRTAKTAGSTTTTTTTITRSSSSSTRSIHVSSALRGGASSSERDTADVEETKTLARSPTLWGSISSAFQLNIDAKDELIHERYDDSRNGESDRMEGDDDNGGDVVKLESRNDVELDSEIKEEGKDSENEVIVVDPKGIDADTAVDERSLELIKVTRSHGINETDIPANQSMNVKKVGDVSLDLMEQEEEEEDNDEERDNDYEEDYDYDEEEDDDNNDTSMLTTNMDTSDKQEAIDVKANMDERLNNNRINLEPPSLEEIVREEWSMIPDTEVEDEGKENEIKYPHRIDRSTKRKNPSKDQQDKTSQRGDGSMPIMDNDVEDEDEEMYDFDRYHSTRQELGRYWPDERESNKFQMVQVAKKPISAGNQTQDSPYISSGLWSTIDRVSSLGLSTTHEDLRLSRKLRSIRKIAAHYTGLHGFVSGKGRNFTKPNNETMKEQQEELNEEDLGAIRRRLAAIEAARRRVASAAPDLNTVAARAARQAALTNIPRWRRPIARLMMLRPGLAASNDPANKGGSQSIGQDRSGDDEQGMDMPPKIPNAAGDRPMPRPPRFMTEEEKERVKEIDRMIQQGQRRILELQIKKDALQRSPNPFYNYTTTTKSNTVEETESQNDEATSPITNTRIFNFPSEKLVVEYLEELYAMGRLQKMNHTDLWKRKPSSCGEDDEEIGDDLLTPSGDARKLYQDNNNHNHNNHGSSRKNGNNNVGGGSWLLRQSLGTGSKLGEKIGEAIENVAYRGVCSAIMAILARSIAALHGVNVMKHSDIRLFMETATDLPPVSKSIFQDEDYAKEAIGKAIRKGSKKKKRRKQRAYQYGIDDSGDESFVQRDAVVETLISHCQISAPLLKLFPQAWQRALLGNIITLIAAVVSDFAEGVQFQILGHQLSFSFKPITEADMIQHIGVGGFRFNHRRAKPEEFEAAVRATADDICQGLGFLDRWHQRALGGDLLRAQIGNLIARVVLTLVDEVLHSARMDLWSAQVGGPRIVAGLEYRKELGDGLETFK